MTKEQKSITIISNGYPSPERPVRVFVQSLAHAMIEQGVRVTIVAYQSLTHSLIHREKLLPRHCTGVTGKGVEYDIYRPYTLSFGHRVILKKIMERFNQRSILSFVKKVNSDVLYAHFWSSALPVYEYAKKNNMPLFVACGEGDDALEEMVQAMPAEQLAALSSAVTGVVSVSSENKRKCIEFNLSRAKNTEVFPNCVNIDYFHSRDAKEMKKKLGIKESDFVICFVGGFIPRKGPDRVAQAIRNLNDSKIKVMFIGKPFPGYAYDFDCPGIIHKGPLDHVLIPLYMSCADVFVLPTYKEGCSNAVVEALAMGLPVISSDGAFNDDILNEKNSIRIDPADVDALTEAIRRLRDDMNLRQSMSEYSLSRHTEYSIDVRARKILDFIEDKANKW